MIDTLLIRVGRVLINLGSRSTLTDRRSTSHRDLGPVQDQFKWILVGEVDHGVDHEPLYGTSQIISGFQGLIGPPTAHECLGIRAGRLTVGCARCSEIRAGAAVRRWGIAYV